MLAVQPRLPLGMPFRPRTRNVRRPFTPSFNDGPYRLPRDVQDRLTASLAPYRNREAAFALATFLGRFWSTPARIIDAFPIDRRELANHPALGLTEAKVRGAIRVLEEAGFLDRAIASGSRYKATEDGLQRKPILFVFGSEYAPAFIAANRRATAARGGHPGERRPITLTNAPRQPTAAVGVFTRSRQIPPEAAPNSSNAKSPKGTSEADRSVIMGEIRESGIPPQAFEPNPKLEAALNRLLQGIRQSRGGSGDGSAR
jgi:hypothetical protein